MNTFGSRRPHPIVAAVVAVMVAAGPVFAPPASHAQPTPTPEAGVGSGPNPDPEQNGSTEGEAPPPPPPIVISEIEALACAARLEPMAASFDKPADSIYLRRMGDTGFQIWAPREDGPNAPLRPWCVTTLAAISNVPFLSADTRTLVMGLVAAAEYGPPPPPGETETPETVAPPPAPEIIMEEQEEEEPRGLPAAFQRTPPMAGRSAPRLGLPVNITAALDPMASDDAQSCLSSGGRPVAEVDRFSGKVLAAACWMGDGTSTPLPSLASHLGVE